MKKILLLLLLTTHLALPQAAKTNSDFLRAEGTKIVDKNGENVLLRGIGLGGHMLQEGYMLKVPFSGQQYVFRQHVEELVGEEKTQEFYDAWLANHTRKIDVDSLKSWGFNSIRLPMHYNLYTLPIEQEPVAGENTWLEKGFQMTDSLLSWCKANGMYLILDMHAAPGGQGHDLNISDRDPSKPSLWESEANQQKLVALWKKLAERYKDEPWIGAYDIINEPNWSFQEGKHKHGVEDTGNEPLRKLMVEITQAIREVDQNHIVIIEGNGWGNNYNGVLPPWDDNMVLSFHKYWNNNEQEAIQKFVEYREKYQIPIWLGETGENSNVWFTDAIELMEDNNIGWCWWPLKKLGFNNPLEVVVNPGYQKILNYWKGEGEKPTAAEAYEAFMQLAENTKLENNIYHKDVVDAMIRQPHSDETVPFTKVVVGEEALIKAADYDMGRLGIAYHDNDYGNYYISTGGDRTGWNNGRTYRNDGVDIFRNSADEVYVGDLETGEWMQYTLEVKDPGKYLVEVKVSSEKGGKASLTANERNPIEFEINNPASTWSWQEAGELFLEAGENKIKFLVKQEGFDLESIRISR